MVDTGLIVLVSFISPFHAKRKMARELFESYEFLGIFVYTTLEECERCDTKGLYAESHSGTLKNFTGIDSPYEPPDSAEMTLYTENRSSEDNVTEILQALNVKAN